MCHILVPNRDCFVRHLSSQVGSVHFFLLSCRLKDSSPWEHTVCGPIFSSCFAIKLLPYPYKEFEETKVILSTFFMPGSPDSSMQELYVGCHMRMAGSYQGCQLVLDHHHDSQHICGRIMGPLVASNISLVQCMVWSCIHAVLQGISDPVSCVQNYL